MGLIDFVKSKISRVPLYSKRASLTSLFSAGDSNSSNYFTSWVYLAVTIIAQEVAGIKLKLYKQDSKGNVEQVFDHPALKLLYKANDQMTQYDLFERLQANLELRGNEYWFLTYGAGKMPITIFPLSPEKVMPVGDEYEYVKEYVYQFEGQKIVIPKTNIIHFKQFNPNSDIVGLSTLEAARLAADTDNSARVYNKKFFQNSARPEVILEFPEVLDPESEKRILADWNQKHAGASNQFKTAIASGGLKVNTFQITQKDMEFLQGRSFNRDEIMAIFRVPLAIAGYTGNETYASAKAAAYAFGARTISPKMTRVVNTLNEFYLKLFPDTEGMYFEFVSPILEDREAIIREYQTGLASGWLSVNDVRRKEDLPEIDGGERVFIPFSVQELGAPDQSKTIKHDPVTKLAEAIAQKTMHSIKLKEEPKEEKKNEIDEAFEAKGAYMIKARDERGMEYERQFNKRLKELWSEQQKEAIKNLNIRLAKKELITKAKELIDAEKEVKRTIDLFSPLFYAIVEREGEAAAEFLLGSSEFTLSPNLRKFLEGNTKKFAGEITKETSARLRSTIAAGLEAGEAIPDLTKRILQSTAFTAPRAEMIARTETLRAQGKAQLDVWKESGVVTAKIWYTAEDERVCPNCGPMHQKKIPLNDYFFKRGDTAPGGLALDYESIDIAELHPQCRCTLIPVIE